MVCCFIPDKGNLRTAVWDKYRYWRSNNYYCSLSRDRIKLWFTLVCVDWL